jgi:hypothetical protein
VDITPGPTAGRAREQPGGVDDAGAGGGEGDALQHAVRPTGHQDDRLGHRHPEQGAGHHSRPPDELVLADDEGSDPGDENGGESCEWSAHGTPKVVCRPMAQRPVVPSRDADWTVQAADTVERVVTGIRDKTTVPLTTVARGLVYGQIAAVAAMTGIVLLAVLLVRIGDSYLPVHPHARAVWITEAIVGGIFLLPGVLLLRRASARRKSR